MSSGRLEDVGDRQGGRTVSKNGVGDPVLVVA